MLTRPDSRWRPTTAVACTLAFAAALTAACTGDSTAHGGPASAATGTEADDTSAGPALDLADDGQGARCTKVDLLFVIDDSHSMASEQGALIASFPAFIAGIRATLDPSASYQVGVITTDAYPFNTSGCRELGALVTQTGGASSSDRACGPFGEGENSRSFMTESDELDAAFACAAQVGVGGSTDERPIEATLEALGSSHEHGCNEGFGFVHVP